jgi:Flp pilus assembly protein TadB
MTSPEIPARTTRENVGSGVDGVPAHAPYDGSVFVFILILLLLAAIFGVLGAVLKVTLVIVLSVLLTVTCLAAFGYWWVRYRMYRYRRDVQRAYDEQQRRSLPGP